MTDKNINDAIDGNKRLRVHLVPEPAIDNPVRTVEDYRQEQKEARERHAMFQEQHKIIQKSYRNNLFAVWSAIVAAIAAVVIASLTFLQVQNKQQPEKVPLQSNKAQQSTEKE